MLCQQGGSVRPLLMQVGFDVEALKAGLDQVIEELPVVNNPTGDIQPSRNLLRILNLADKQAQQNKDQFIASETVLSAMMSDTGPLGKVLNNQGVSKTGSGNRHQEYSWR